MVRLEIAPSRSRDKGGELMRASIDAVGDRPIKEKPIWSQGFVRTLLLRSVEGDLDRITLKAETPTPQC